MKYLILLFVVLWAINLIKTQITSPNNCSTPNQTAGECIKLQKCNSLFQLMLKHPLTSEEETFLRRSQCGHVNSTPLVCCPVAIDHELSHYNSNIKAQARFDTDNVNNETCLTPQNEKGTCIYLQSCNSLYQILIKTNLQPEDKNLLSASQCGHKNRTPLVCCPISERVNLLPLPGECGIGPISNRIIGGGKTLIDEYPWMALLEYSKPNYRKGLHCGGVLISQKYVLTACHCVSDKFVPSSWQLTGVRLGEWNISSSIDCEINENNDSDCAPPTLNVPIEEIIPHALYNYESTNKLHDIALLRLQTPVQSTEFIKPICLPKTELLQSIDLEGFTLYVSGWGITENEVPSEIKLKVGVDVVNITKCNIEYRNFSVILEDSQICAGGLKDKDACRGDSGGPLMGIEQNATVPYFYLAGIVSFGPTPCGSVGIPGVYTKVSSYIDWIESKMRL